MPDKHPNPTDWNTWAQYVLKNIDTSITNQEQMSKDLNDFKIEMTEKLTRLQSSVRIYSALWGTIAGAIISAMVFILLGKIIT